MISKFIFSVYLKYLQFFAASVYFDFIKVPCNESDMENVALMRVKLKCGFPFCHKVDKSIPILD